MDINYIILAHKNPKQLRRLIEKLSMPNCYFYLHVDKNVDITPFFKETESLRNVCFISNSERENGTWGDIGIVKATINALKMIIDDKRTGHAILLSGQDYPIKSNESIYSFLFENKNNSYIEKFPIPADFWPNSGLDRINKYKFNLSDERGDFVQIPSVFEFVFYSKNTFKKIIRLIRNKKHNGLLNLFSKRKFPNYIKPYGGSQWWALNIETIHKVITFIQNTPNYLNYHHYSLLPDEIFFQSIIMHLAENDSAIILKDSLMYVNWTRKNCQLPVTFTSSDFEELIGQGDNKFFARKFDVELDEAILNRLDVLI